MPQIAFVLGAFLAGSLPFSVWVGHMALGRDIRTVGDANPGATNVLRAGGKAAAAAAFLLDFAKGSVPVGIAHVWFQWSGWSLVLIALAPVLGHAFSPLLHFRGGKAVAVTGGIWCGLTAWEGPTVGGILLGLFTYFLGANGRAVLAAMAAMALYFLVTPAVWNQFGIRPPTFPILSLIWLGNVAILAWKHRADFSRR